MNASVPTAAAVRQELLVLSHAQLQRLARLSSVPFTTLWKIRDGTTKNPGIETVRLFMAHMGEVVIQAAPPPTTHLAGEGTNA